MRISSFVQQKSVLAKQIKKKVLHSGRTCLCLMTLPEKKGYFTLFSLANSFFSVFFFVKRNFIGGFRE